MKKLCLLLTALAFTQCVNDTLTESEVSDFVTSHFNEKVGYDDAVDSFIEDIGEDLTVLNTLWGQSRLYPVENVDSEWFYEDSVTVANF